MDRAAPIRCVFDLSRLSEAGYETTITASATELADIAAWEGVDALSCFEGRIALKRLSSNRFVYTATLAADIRQSCVVTLEPVKTHIDRSFSRELHHTSLRHDVQPGAISLSPTDDDSVDEIDSLKFDLAAPLLEEFSLAVDPYPRAPGVTFDSRSDTPAGSANPFAVLKGLKPG